MYLISDRCSVLREEAVNQKHYMKYFCAQRAVYYTLGVADTIGKGLANEEVIAAGIVNTI